MPIPPQEQEPPGESTSPPPGRLKIMDALRALLREKEFSAITWSDIARTAGVNEALIYKYFKDSRNLLHEVLKESLSRFVRRLNRDLKGVQGARNKLRKLIWSTIDMYDSERVFAKILFLEVRNFPGYFRSETYRIVQEYAGMILGIIDEGIRKGELRRDIPPKLLRQVVLGAMEHAVLPGIIFDKPLRPDQTTEALCRIIFEDILARPSNRQQGH